MYGLHYNNTKAFKEKQFKGWSNKAIELRNKYSDEQIDEFKIELKKSSKFIGILQRIKIKNATTAFQ